MQAGVVDDIRDPVDGLGVPRITLETRSKTIVGGISSPSGVSSKDFLAPGQQPEPIQLRIYGTLMHAGCPPGRGTCNWTWEKPAARWPGWPGWLALIFHPG